MTHQINRHDTLEVIKIPVVLDGDLALSLSNILIFCEEHHFLEELIFCENVEPKLNALMERIQSMLDVENREEI